MRTLLALALIAQASTAPNLAGEWVGPLEVSDAATKRRGPIPTRVEITHDANGVIRGQWVTMRPNTMSGSWEGRIAANGRITVIATFYGDAGVGDDLIKPEACKNEAQFVGGVTASGMLRLTAKSADDTRMMRRCDSNILDLIWLLQRDTH